MPKNFDDASSDWIYSPELEQLAKIIWNTAIESCIKACDEADESAHRGDLADELKKLYK